MQKRALNQKESLSLITLTLSSQIFNESLDDLRHTSVFKQNFKNIMNKAEKMSVKELTPIVEHYYETSEMTSQGFIIGIEEIAKLIAKADPSIVIRLGELLSEGVNIMDIITEKENQNEQK